MKLKEWVQRIEHAVPPDWALPDDPIGLQIGDREQEIRKIFVGLEMSTSLVQRATQSRANLILVHHPLIYRPLKRLLENDPVQRLIRELIRNDIALYAAHTNMDLHPQGMAQVWARKLGCSSMHPLAAKPQGKQLKLVTFIPPEYTDALRDALGKAGAGAIGEYTRCSFTLRGEGTFLGSDHTHPFVGEKNNFERVNEDRLEMILPERHKWAVINALYASHPYDEPAYDLYILDEYRDLRQALWIAEYTKKLSWKEWMNRIHASLPKLKWPTEVRPNRKSSVKRFAISTGSGSSFISMVSSLGVDAFLTGEVGYHSLWEANEAGLNVVTVGHDLSESFFAETIIPLFKKDDDAVEWNSDAE